MKKIHHKIAQAVTTCFPKQKPDVSMDDLITYPKDSMGFHLGCFLFNNSCEADPQPAKEDIYRLLIAREVSNTEEVAMNFYLFGNGDISLRTIFIMASGMVFYPHRIMYFYSRYKEGKQALRFYDLDHWRMLHLPLKRVKDTFLIR
jgi:hypothetical protein